MKVFLGGTVNGSTWRDEIIPLLKVDYFNPVVDDWDEKAYHRELFERENCEFCLYVLTPKMTGFYAIAEVIDDSYKKTDKTIFCYLKQDIDCNFDDNQIESLEKTGRTVLENGGVWLKSLEEVILFLNAANQLEDSIITIPGAFHNVFISYGRRHSLVFAKKLHSRLTAMNLDVWFDQNDIPLGVDFQEQIDEGIKRADNFVFIISPHSVKSVYCMKEIVLALKYNKRIIPILHIEPTDCYELVHPAIGKINWIYAREKENFDIPQHEWNQIDSFETAFKGLTELLDRHKVYLRQHTAILEKATVWEQKGKPMNRLLVGKDRQIAENWLLTDFKNEQSPCMPTDLHCEYICEAKKNAHNMMTDVFVSFAAEDSELCNRIVFELSRYAITAWLHHKDIEKGSDFISSIENGIIKANNVIYIISHNSHNSDYCGRELSIAINNNKRIIPLIIDNIDTAHLPKEVKTLQYIDFTHTAHTETDQLNVEQRKEKSPFHKAIDQLIQHLHKDHDYYEQHKVLLYQAYKWVNQNMNYSILLRGHNLEKAVSWLKMGDQMPHKPSDIHRRFIAESLAKAGMFKSEVFISYSRTDSDFARKLNEDLQLTGKTTWFDQESIAAGADFQREIYKGIESSDNFLFIISPDAVKSPYCADEVNYAAQFNKRFITLLLRETNVTDIPSQLAMVQWIDFQNREFREAFGEVIRTIDTDREYVGRHTRYMQLAAEWNDAKNYDQQNRSKDLVLRASEFNNATAWIYEAFGLEPENYTGSFLPLKDKTPTKQPAPTLLQIDFIEESRLELELAILQERQQQEKMLLLEKEKVAVAHRMARRQRMFLILVSFALIIAIILGIYSVIQSKKAIQSERLAKEQKDIALQREKDAQWAKNNAELEKAKADSLKTTAEISAENARSEKEKAENAQRMALIQSSIARNLNTISENLINDLLRNQTSGLSGNLMSNDEEKYMYFKKKGIEELRAGSIDDALADFKIAQFWTKSKNIEDKGVDYFIYNGWGSVQSTYNLNNTNNVANQAKLSELIRRANTLKGQINEAENYFIQGSFGEAKALYLNMLDYPEKISMAQIQITEIQRLDSIFEPIRNSYDIKPPKEIDLSGKGLSTIPSYIWDNINLISLNLSNNQIKSLPNDIMRLVNLKDINLSNNQLEELPPYITQLRQLRTMNVSNNKLKSLPLNMAQLSQIEQLNMSFNELTEINMGIYSMRLLKRLDGSNNQIESVHHTINQLIHLTYFNFSFNTIGSLPESMCELTKLTELDMANTSLTGLPTNIAKLSELKKLNVANCQITQLPQDIGNLSKLESIQLRGNLLESIPVSISMLKNIRELNLENNMLITLPNEIGQLTQLKSLNLSNNQLTSLPADISKLSGLISLDLNKNALTQLPDEFAALNVASVYITNNQLTTIPQCLYTMPKVVRINLSFNAITEIPADIKMMKNVEKISLDNNQIRIISDEINQLTKLQQLTLIRNPISENQKQKLNKLLPTAKIAYSINQKVY